MIVAVFYYHSTIMLFARLFIYMADNMVFMFICAKITIDKTGLFKYKTRHKSTSNMADKLLCIPVWASRRPGSAPFPHLGVPTTETRVPSGFASCF